MRVIGFLLFVAVLGAGVWYGLKRMTPDAAQPAQSGPPPAVSVVAVAVEKKNVDVFLSGLGTVQAYSTVTVHTQIDGQLSHVLFKEGQDVKKGDRLAEIDPRIYQAQLEQAQARKKQDQAKELQDGAILQQDLAKKAQDEANQRQAESKKAQDEVALANARVNLKRNEESYKVAAVSEQMVADQRSLVHQLEETVKGDQAGIESLKAAVQASTAACRADEAALEADQATIQADEAAIRYAQTFLSYTSILSPIDGRTGVRQVDAGNIVHANDAKGLVVITQLEPISILFTLPQQNLRAIAERMAQEPLKVYALDADTKKELDQGVLELIDNQIDQTTGTILLKATFPNARRSLWPGGYVNVRLLLETRKDAVVVSTSVVQQGPNGPFVFRVKDDETVEMRPVKVDLIQDGQAILASGVAPGDMVVLSGQDRLRVGSKVTLAKPGQSGKRGEAPVIEGEGKRGGGNAGTGGGRGGQGEGKPERKAEGKPENAGAPQ